MHSNRSNSLSGSHASAIPLAQLGRFAQNCGKQGIIAQQGHPVKHGVLPQGVGNLVDETFRGKAGVAIGITAQPAGRQGKLDRHMLNPDMRDIIGRHRPFTGHGIGFASPGLDRRFRRQIVKQTRPKFPMGRRAGDPHLPVFGGAVGPARQFGREGDRGGRAGRDHFAFFGARPSQLHRLRHLVGNLSGFYGVHFLQPCIKAAAG